MYELKEQILGIRAKIIFGVRTARVFELIGHLPYHSLLMSELLSNILLFVGQLYADKLLVLRARDLPCFTTDLQTVIYYSTIHF